MRDQSGDVMTNGFQVGQAVRLTWPVRGLEHVDVPYEVTAMDESLGFPLVRLRAAGGCR